MPSILKSRIALVALIGVFLIPIMSSSLRGLTHVLTCEGSVETPFSVVVEEGTDPIVHKELGGALAYPDVDQVSAIR